LDHRFHKSFCQPAEGRSEWRHLKDFGRFKYLLNERMTRLNVMNFPIA